VRTTAYTVQVNLDKAAAKQGPRARQQVAAIEKVLGTHTLPVQVWLDAQGRVRKVSANVPIPNTGSPASSRPAGTFTVSEEFYDFGTPVTTQPPPRSQTTDITQQIITKVKNGTG